MVILIVWVWFLFPFLKLQVFRTKGKMVLFLSKVFCQYTYFKSLTHDKRMQISSKSCPQTLLLLLSIIRLFQIISYLDLPWLPLQIMCSHFYVYFAYFWWSPGYHSHLPLLSNLMIGANIILKTYISLSADYSLIVKATANSCPGAQEGAGPSSLGRKALTIGSAAQISHHDSHLLFSESCLIFLKYFCMFSSSP